MMKKFDKFNYMDDPNVLVAECVRLVEGKNKPLQEGVIGVAAGITSVVAMSCIEDGWSSVIRVVKSVFGTAASNIYWQARSDKSLQQEYLEKFPFLSTLPPKEREAKLKQIIETSYSEYYKDVNGGFVKYTYTEQYTEEEIKAMKANMSFYEKLMDLSKKLLGRMSSSLFYGVAAMFVFAAACVIVIALCNGRFGRFIKLLSDLVAEFMDALKKVAYAFVHSIITLNPAIFDDIVKIMSKFYSRALEIFDTIKEEGFLSSVITMCVASFGIAILGVFGLISFIMDNRDSGSTKYIAGGFMQ